jgi:hypothetical protein
LEKLGSCSADAIGRSFQASQRITSPDWTDAKK